jgi:eukaryotic-like serine/threonine-protein kinase
MSPEQVRGGTVDARSDIYSVGAMMYELFAGRPPFVSDSTYDILNQQCNTAPLPPIEVNQQLPVALNDIILCALAKDPAHRFQNAQAISNALRQVAAAQNNTPKVEEVPFTPVVIPGAAPAAALARPPSTHRGAWISLGAVAVLVVLACAAVGLPRLFHTSAKTESNGNRTAQALSSPGSPPSPSTAPATAAQNPEAEAPVASTSQDSPKVPDEVPPPQAPVKPDSGTPTHSKTVENPKSPKVEHHPDEQPGTVSQSEVTPQSANTGPTAEEVAQVHEQMTGLDARASAVSASLETLKRQQEADGLGLRRDMAAAYTRMNSYMRAASDELNSGNINAARSHMDKADKEISTLESFLGK